MCIAGQGGLGKTPQSRLHWLERCEFLDAAVDPFEPHRLHRRSRDVRDPVLDQPAKEGVVIGAQGAGDQRASLVL